MKETEMIIGSVKEERGDVSVVSIIKKLITQRKGKAVKLPL